MSRGLGKIERKIINILDKRTKEREHDSILKDRGEEKYWFFLSDIVYYVFDHLTDEAGDIVKHATRAQYVSVWRAAKSLEGKGVVQTQIIPYAPNLGQGGVTHASKVKLNVDFIAKMVCNQHLKEGYIANWKNYPKNEIKIRVARPSILAPSNELLEDWKKGKITWEEYEKRLKEEIYSNPKAVERLKEIKKLVETKDVRLICYEKKPPCHRFTLITMIEEMKTEL